MRFFGSKYLSKRANVNDWKKYLHTFTTTEQYVHDSLNTRTKSHGSKTLPCIIIIIIIKHEHEHEHEHLCAHSFFFLPQFQSAIGRFLTFCNIVVPKNPNYNHYSSKNQRTSIFWILSIASLCVCCVYQVPMCSILTYAMCWDEQCKCSLMCFWWWTNMWIHFQVQSTAFLNFSFFLSQFLSLSVSHSFSLARWRLCVHSSYICTCIYDEYNECALNEHCVRISPYVWTALTGLCLTDNDGHTSG